MRLDARELDADIIDTTLGVLLKYQDDIVRLRGAETAGILDEVRVELAAAE